MAQRTVSNLAAGCILGGFGVLSLGLGLIRAPFLPESVASLPGYALASLSGAVFLLGGVLFAVFSVRAPPEETEITPAHVAFVSRQVRVSDSDLHHVTAKPRKPLVAPKASMDPEAVAMDRLNREIRELTRAINKAGVLLATGQISDSGYAAYVEELKKQRGTLEADRLRIEMRKRAH